MRNWSGNLNYGSSEILTPSSVGEAQEIVQRTHRVKALGTRHSFSAISDTTGVQISTAALNRILSITPGTVTVEPGVTYGELALQLHAERLSLSNMASLPHISVAGACATSTHGSGDENGSLSTSVSAMKIIRADGSLATLKRGDPDFEGNVVHLGALGIVAELSLDVVPAFSIYQSVFQDLPFSSLSANFEAIMSAAYSVSLFTDWASGQIDQIWLKSREPIGSEFFGAVPASQKLHPIRSMPPDFCTDQLGMPGPAFERLPHFKMEFTPSSGQELQSEYLIESKDAVPVLMSIEALRDEIGPLLHVSEIRSVAADSLWLSPAYGRPTVGIHFTWRDDWPKVSRILPKIESLLAEFNPRPHWGKLNAIPGSKIAGSYPRWADFCELRHRIDPHGKFSNALLDALPH
jgi:xylitol oxidase